MNKIISHVDSVTVYPYLAHGEVGGGGRAARLPVVMPLTRETERSKELKSGKGVKAQEERPRGGGGRTQTERVKAVEQQ